MLKNILLIDLILKVMGECKSLQPFHLKTGAPSNANFRRIKQGGYAKRNFSDVNILFYGIPDIPRMLRAPGTTNFKTEEKPICEILEYNDIRYKVEDFEKYMQETSSQRISGYCDVTDDFACMGAGSAEELIEKCAFLQHCKANASELSEPLWHAAIANIALTSDGREKCHEISSPYPGYTYSETDKKYLNAVKEDEYSGAF